MTSAGIRERPDSGTPDATAANADQTDDGKAGLLVPFCVWLASRAYLLALGYAAPHLLRPLRINRPLLPRSDPLAAAWPWTSPWFRFDAAWYVGVAQHGYHWGNIHQTNTNFFPLYALLIRLLEPVTLGSAWIAGWIISNVAFLIALCLLWRWARVRWDREIALRVVLLVVVFPFSFFFLTPYAESLFLTLAVAAFLAAERDRWGLAVACAGLSTITRPVGLAVVAGLVLFALLRHDRRRALLALLGVLPFVAFVGYLGLSTGHPLAFTAYHTPGWVRPHGGLLTTIGSQFHTSLSPFDRVDVAVGLLFLVSSIGVWRKIGPPYAVYVLLGLALPLTKGLGGLERYVIVLFPVMALWATWRSKAGQAAVFALSLLLLTVATTMFAVGYSLF